MILSFFLLVFISPFASFSSGRSITLSRPVQPDSDHSRSGLHFWLSHNASISQGTAEAPRWSTFDAPDAGFVVSVATEDDVRATVQYCISNDRPFLAQGGGHGWISNFHLNSSRGVLIDLESLNSVTFSPDRKQVKIGGGALVSDVVGAAAAANSEVVVGNCNCIGALGATLGGGYGNLLGLYGFSVDNVLAMNVVLANGSMVANLTQGVDSDLFWALLGAGPNFGIVTSVIMKAYPLDNATLLNVNANINGSRSPSTPVSDITSVPNPITSNIISNASSAWTGTLSFSPSKLEPLIAAIDDLILLPPMNVFLYFINNSIQAVPFYYGGDIVTGRAAFASLFAVGPSSDDTSVVPYTSWNAAATAAGLCTKGARKPAYGAGLARMDPHTWRAVWESYRNFSNAYSGEVARSLVLLEAYSLARAQTLSTLGDESSAASSSAAGSSAASFPNRDVRFNAVVIPWYTDAALDGAANAFASRVRDMWRATAGFAPGVNRTYVNFAHGDESPETVYAGSLDRLRVLKARYDPKGWFGHWLPLD